MAGNVVYGLIFGNVVASIFNVSMIGRSVKGWHLIAFWACAVTLGIVVMCQAPPIWQ